MTTNPNIFLFMVDELRYPTVYDTPELRTWMNDNLIAQDVFQRTGVEFQRHYTASTACAPSRTSIFTGQYPSLHGVTQTDGIGKHAWDPGMFWLDPDTVPTLGDWMRAAGYDTYYKGKWHVSFADIVTPGTHNSVQSNGDGGGPYPIATEKYAAGNRLEEYGFDGWIGPEPHGSAQANSGWRRDPLFADEMIDLIDRLEARTNDKPLLLVNSFVNPHDIVLYGILWKHWGLPFSDPSLDAIAIPEPPTQNEELSTKPGAQKSYVDTYPKMFLPQTPDEVYRKFYYLLQKTAEQHVHRVYERFRQSRFFDNSIVIFTSDHGDMLGAHGGMHQKWYQAYEEAIHVPLYFSGPLIPDPNRAVSTITSHIDLIPTILGLAGIDVEAAQRQLEETHTETRPLAGRDLSSLVMGTGNVPQDEPVYFMTKDDVSAGLEQITGRRNWDSVITPNQVETIVVNLDGTVWKYTRYHQDESPLVEYINNQEMLDYATARADVAEQFEMYDLSKDPIEAVNLAGTGLAIEETLKDLLEAQRDQKALAPRERGVCREQGEGLLATAPGT
ncbi:MAG TPA: sulfatase-like hydrolase/transferase [Thermoanaerobaculia bacterium]|nr:sulfatase-like hydrolase/transferase [Thermoanaerobaculia bacterium]